MANNRRYSILLVDDERSTREGISRLLQREYDLTLAEDGSRAINILRKNNFDIVVTDLKMPGADGMEVLKESLAKDPQPVCIVMTAYGSIPSAVEATRIGAFEFIQKPLSLDQFELMVKRAVEKKQLTEENKELKRKLNRSYEIGDIIGKSACMHEVFETVKQVAPARTTVMITGESGTGKEMIAHSIHALSGRTGQFVAVHCAALPPTLLESELFGHEKGSFTGASEQRKGRFELADGGTLFLDEIGDIDQSVQVKILRALETRTFERVGGAGAIATDTRVITATNKDLKTLVADGKFREDLYFRLFVVAIHLPPLRERQEDIPLLVKHFLDDFSRENKKDSMSISEEALNVLCRFSWPGNIRELRNCVERMVVLSRSRMLDLHNVPVYIREAFSPGLAKPVLSSNSLNIDKTEKMLIQKALDECSGNITKASAKLGISRRTLHRKLKELKH
ncbi:MAG TPA: transcriptional regulator [Lentisphaeria bacterium]|nr:MAG: transcriptional regulator [Lentisphaerae bacterium GWF2_49_21]HBC86759.1 transcriptional regulator [Lentisphaeria bacterium]